MSTLLKHRLRKLLFSVRLVEIRIIMEVCHLPQKKVVCFSAFNRVKIVFLPNILLKCVCPIHSHISDSVTSCCILEMWMSSILKLVESPTWWKTIQDEDWFVIQVTFKSQWDLHKTSRDQGSSFSTKNRHFSLPILTVTLSNIKCEDGEIYNFIFLCSISSFKTLFHLKYE